MLKKGFFFLLALCSTACLTAQKALVDQGQTLNKKNLFLNRSDKTINYFTLEEGEQNREEMQEQNAFALKGNFTTIYVNWQNPLHYRLEWKDSTYTDERDQLLRDFFDLVKQQFGLGSTDVGKQLNADLLQEDARANASKKHAIKATVELKIPENGFKEVQLTMLYIELRDKRNVLLDNEVEALNKLTPVLMRLDEANNTDISGDLQQTLLSLFKEDDVEKAKTAVEDAKRDTINYRGIIKSIENDQKTVAQFIASLSIEKDKLFQLSVKSKLEDFLKQTSDKLANTKAVMAKFGGILTILDESFKKSAGFKDYYVARTVRISDGKAVQTTLTVAEYAIKDDTKELTRKGEVTKTTFIFRKYDPVTVSVSTGIFFANTNLVNYGIKPAGNEFEVIGDTVSKNTAVTAVFANLNFNTGSRYFAPLVQLGIDPTKKRPFFLLGGGFSVPAVRFAISAGGVWTWDQSLNRLSLGQKIASSTDLDKDVKNNFNVSPRGWYLGIQYNF